MARRRVLLQGETANVVRSLAPVPKRKVRAALAELEHEADLLGEPLHLALVGMWRIRVGRLRIVYRVSRSGVEIMAIGPRETIYTELERKSRDTRSEP